MTQDKPFAPFLGHLAQTGLRVESVAAHGLAPAQVITVQAEDWGRLGQEAKEWGCRWAAGWGEDIDGKVDKAIHIHACFEKGGAYLLARTMVTRTNPILSSHTPSYPAADRPERHTQDMFGVAFTDHPDARRWTRHQAWKSSEYPLRRDFPAAGHPLAATPADHQYKFLAAQGSGVYEIPVGPVHAGIIEPGHFRFQTVGETVLHLEARLGYTHKGIEKIAEGRDAASLARLAGRVSGDSTVAHAWAASMAMEKAAGLTAPPRAVWLRALMCERERVANHLGDIGAIANDVGFAFGFYQFGRLREAWQRASCEVFGHRFMMDCIVPGGVAADLEPRFMETMRDEADALRWQIGKLMAIVYDSPSLTNRLLGTGVLTPEQASALGCMGYVGRASSLDFDVRRDATYPPYDRLKVTVPLHHTGDVNARMRVRHEEIVVSLEVIKALLAGLPDGPVGSEWRVPIADSEGLGIIEGWRGEIISYVRFGAGGRIARFFPRDPSWTTWPALEVLIHDNIVPDFPVCNKSVNGSYSGNDL
ncbi:hydrogenase expression protein HypE [Sulfurimicrobium lacus]|uniref:Hydrogenase expression protein HypE n=1 Tax=Sulfurimicrobium lacus TaxID=2715678 RepID=A0A6F8VCB9_9PROT|nr:NADH-quinone oxidoreductase subunit C [Sulfurimicrobium lacus]BCB27314.1 hydrogenase expression protein HypE [Sulfurimicrobium lacus]